MSEGLSGWSSSTHPLIKRKGENMKRKFTGGACDRMATNRSLLQLTSTHGGREQTQIRIYMNRLPSASHMRENNGSMGWGGGGGGEQAVIWSFITRASFVSSWREDEHTSIHNCTRIWSIESTAGVRSTETSPTRSITPWEIDHAVKDHRVGNHSHGWNWDYLLFHLVIYLTRLTKHKNQNCECILLYMKHPSHGQGKRKQQKDLHAYASQFGLSLWLPTALLNRSLSLRHRATDAVQESCGKLQRGSFTDFTYTDLPTHPHTHTHTQKKKKIEERKHEKGRGKRGGYL